MVELEYTKFRTGESKNRRYGGKVSDKPFPKALYEMAKVNGYESQKSLGKALQHKGNQYVSKWYLGDSTPSPQNFGNLLELFGEKIENADKKEELVQAWADELKIGRGVKGAAQKDNVNVSRVSMKKIDTPLNNWIENFCEQREITLIKFYQSANINSYPGKRNKYGIETLSNILQNIPTAFELNETQTEELSESVVMEIQKKVELRGWYQSNTGSSVIKEQKLRTEPTYNGHQAATKFNVSREAIRKIRNKLGLPLVLTNTHMEQIRSELEKSKDKRAKTQKTKDSNKTN